MSKPIEEYQEYAIETIDQTGSRLPTIDSYIAPDAYHVVMEIRKYWNDDHSRIDIIDEAGLLAANVTKNTFNIYEQD